MDTPPLPILDAAQAAFIMVPVIFSQLRIGVRRPKHRVVLGFLDMHVLEVLRGEERELPIEPLRVAMPRGQRRVPHFADAVQQVVDRLRVLDVIARGLQR